MRRMRVSMCGGALSLILASTACAQEVPASFRDCAHAPLCPPKCEPSCMTCVPVEVPRTRVVYGSMHKEYCLPRCVCCGRDCCGHCQPGCGHVRTRNVLMKLVVDDCPGYKCEPRPCPMAPCLAPGEPIPAPKKVDVTPVSRSAPAANSAILTRR